VFGEHNLQNIEAARHVCECLGISTADFFSFITTFKGAARRLELLAKSERATVFKDFAHSPSKLQATIHAVKKQFPQRELIACIELHTFSSLNKNFLLQYAGTMDDADIAIVFIDKKTFEHKKMEPFSAGTVQRSFNMADLIFFDDPEQLSVYLKNLRLIDKNLLLMSSGNFSGLNLSDIANKIL
jgi:UDP-N-acetylmuramate: L-alanyl-gamma-D-glutamyl-meso-diaminopimelate ligase